MSTVFRHDLPSVEDYLHHRVPYLMIDRIEQIDDTSIICSKKVTGEEYFLEGHFPGAPVVPGAMMQEMTTQAAGILLAARHNPMQEFNTHDPFFNEYAIGVLVRLNGARFRGFARPGDILTINVDLKEQERSLFEFTGRVVVNGNTIMSNNFQLANIKSSTLQGTESHTVDV